MLGVGQPGVQFRTLTVKACSRPVKGPASTSARNARVIALASAVVASVLLLTGALAWFLMK